jgi:hypothetical protein
MMAQVLTMKVDASVLLMCRNHLESHHDIDCPQSKTSGWRGAMYPILVWPQLKYEANHLKTRMDRGSLEQTHRGISPLDREAEMVNKEASSEQPETSHMRIKLLREKAVPYLQRCSI